MYDLNLIVPNLTSEKYSQDNKFLLLKNYLYELNEVLSYALSDKTYGEIAQVKRTVDESSKKQAVGVKRLQVQSVKKFNDLKEQILSTAEEIEHDYTSAIENSEKQLLQSVSSEFVAKGDFGEYSNGVQTQLDQQAQSISLNSQSVEQVKSRADSLGEEQANLKNALDDDIAALEDYKKTARSELSVQSDAIIARVENVYASKNQVEELEGRVSSRIEQSATDITESFQSNLTHTTESIGAVEGMLSELVSDLEVYIRRGELSEGVYGIEIGRTDSNIKARFTNDRLSFYRGTVEVAYVSGNSLYITDAHVLDYLKIGNSTQGYFMFDSTDYGLEVRWIDG